MIAPIDFAFCPLSTCPLKKQFPRRNGVMAQMQQNDNDNAVKKAEEEFLGGKLPVWYRQTQM